MDLAPTPEQQTVQGQARRFLAAELTRERLAAFDREPAGHDAAFWREVAALGWFGFGLPEGSGGQGASLLDVGLLLEECGRAAAPHGVFAAIAAALAVEALASSAHKRVWLAPLAAGERHATIAVAERDAVNDPRAFATVVSRRGKGLVLRGTKWCVPQAVTADVFLVLARAGRASCALLCRPMRRGWRCGRSLRWGGIARAWSPSTASRCRPAPSVDVRDRRGRAGSACAVGWRRCCARRWWEGPRRRSR